MPVAHLEGAAPFSASNGAAGVLVLHGYTGIPVTVRGLAEAFADAGLCVELPLLPGHGTRVEDLVPMHFSDWAEAAESVYLDLAARCDAVVVTGLSMGGTLACWLAQHHADVAGLVLINPLIQPAAEEGMKLMQRALDAGATVFPSIGADIHRPGPPLASYDQTPIAPLVSLYEATAEVAAHLSQITCPVLLFSSRVDHVVDPVSGDLAERGIAGPVERVFLESSYHVATLDYDAEEIEHRAVAFVHKLVA